MDTRENDSRGGVAPDGQAVSLSGGLPATLAKRILFTRTQRHLSQRDLAARVQCPRTYISKIERGRVLPTLGSLERIAEGLNTTIQKLLSDEATFAASIQTEALLQNPFLAEIASLLPNVSSTDRLRLRAWLQDRAPVPTLRAEKVGPLV